MDISKYINEHLDELIDNPDFLNDNPDLIKIPNFINKENYDSDEHDEHDDLDEFDDLDDDLDDELDDELNRLDEPKELELNEDDYQDDIKSELYQNMYERFLLSHSKDNLESNKINKINKTNKSKVSEEESDEESDEEELDKEMIKEKEMEYYINLMNIFMRYYNEKFDKTDNFFTGIKNSQADTSEPMELFYEAIIEYNLLKKQISEDLKEQIESSNTDTDIINEFANKFIFDENNSDRIEHLFQTWEHQIYCLSLQSNRGNKKYYSPSLIVCLNYININNINNDLSNLNLNSSWNIFNLRDN